jgi:hypothetical protein
MDANKAEMERWVFLSRGTHPHFVSIFLVYKKIEKKIYTLQYKSYSDQ